MKNRSLASFRRPGVAAALVASMLLVACASAPQNNAALDAARSAYQQASSDANVVRSATVELSRAQEALQKADATQSAGADVSDVSFYANLANKRTQVAVQTGQVALAEKAAADAAAQRDKIVLEARTREVDSQRGQVQAAQAQASSADARAKALEAQLAEMNAKKTNRGLVLTLGDVLFDTGRAELQSGADRALDQLVQFMGQNPERTLKIEGYTDSVGSDSSNQVLSERRAIAVKNALIDRGVVTAKPRLWPATIRLAAASKTAALKSSSLARADLSNVAQGGWRAEVRHPLSFGVKSRRLAKTEVDRINGSSTGDGGSPQGKCFVWVCSANMLPQTASDQPRLVVYRRCDLETMSAPSSFVLAGVMGWPISHSRSPIIHNHWIAQYGLKGSYAPLPVAPDNLPDALRGLRALGFAGCNLTIPHKVAAMALVDQVDATARRMGALNTIVVQPDGSLHGFNNDGTGFIQSLLDEQPDWRADTGPVVVLGAGGAARAVVVSLAERGAKEIRVLNRTAAKAQALADEFGAPVQAVPWEQRNEALADAALLVNTTNQGMVGQPALDLALDALPKHALVCDVIYTPLETPLLQAAKARGHVTVNGLGMLLNQARPAFNAWFGVMPEITPALRAAIVATF